MNLMTSKGLFLLEIVGIPLVYLPMFGDFTHLRHQDAIYYLVSQSMGGASEEDFWNRAEVSEVATPHWVNVFVLAAKRVIRYV